MTRNDQRRLKSLAIVVPFYNEAAGARHFYERVRKQMDVLPIAVSLVFVDDGSRDETLGILNRIADEDSRVSVLSFARNWGHQAALTAGLDHIDPTVEAVVMMDADLQHPPETILPMIAEYERGADIVSAVRRQHNGAGRFKRLASNGFNALMTWSTRVDVCEGAADFRLVSRNVIEILKGMRETHRYLRGMVPWLGFASAVVQYRAGAEVCGHARLHLAAESASRPPRSVLILHAAVEPDHVARVLLRGCRGRCTSFTSRSWRSMGTPWRVGPRSSASC